MTLKYCNRGMMNLLDCRKFINSIFYVLLSTLLWLIVRGGSVRKKVSYFEGSRFLTPPNEQLLLSHETLFFINTIK